MTRCQVQQGWTLWLWGAFPVLSLPWTNEGHSRQEQAAPLRQSTAFRPPVLQVFPKGILVCSVTPFLALAVDGGVGWREWKGSHEAKRCISIFIPVVCSPVSFPPFPAVTRWVRLSVWHAFFLHSSFTSSHCSVYFQGMIIQWTPMYMLLEKSCGIDYDSIGSLVRKKVVLGSHRR